MKKLKLTTTDKNGQRQGRGRKSSLSSRRNKVKVLVQESHQPQASSARGAKTIFRESGKVADWDEYLADPVGIPWICPVDYFVNAPFADKWESFAKEGMKIEVPHPQMVGDLPVYCIATIKMFAGYKALIQFEHLEKDGQTDIMFAWINFCSPCPKPLTYSVKNGILILPVDAEGSEIRKPDYDFKTLVKNFSEKFFSKSDTHIYDTVSWNHEEVVITEIENHHKDFHLGRVVEVIDKENPSISNLGAVIGIIGDRILIRYLENMDDDSNRDKEVIPDMDVNSKSEYVHPVGWSGTVGVTLKHFSKYDAPFPFLHKRSFPTYPSSLKIQKNMVFEMRHPYRPHEIVSGFVYQKLNHGYFIASVDTTEENDSTKCIFHITSDYILPCGFCAEHNLPLQVPYGESPDSFRWDEYCAKRRISMLDLSSLPKKPSHKFVKECKLESAGDGLLDNYFGPATVTNVANHLLQIHFDGWTKAKPEFSQWISAFSPNIYPAGWAEMVGYNFQSHAEPHLPENTYYIKRSGG